MQEPGRHQSLCLLTTACSSQIYLITNLGRCLSHVSHRHTPLKKNDKNEQMMKKCFSAEFPRALDFEPWCHELVQRCLNTCHSCVF